MPLQDGDDADEAGQDGGGAGNILQDLEAQGMNIENLEEELDLESSFDDASETEDLLDDEDGA